MLQCVVHVLEADSTNCSPSAVIYALILNDFDPSNINIGLTKDVIEIFNFIDNFGSYDSVLSYH
jgi:hypothetical protein